MEFLIRFLMYITTKFNVKYARKSCANTTETVTYYTIIWYVLLQNLQYIADKSVPYYN